MTKLNKLGVGIFPTATIALSCACSRVSPSGDSIFVREFDDARFNPGGEPRNVISESDAARFNSGGMSVDGARCNRIGGGDGGRRGRDKAFRSGIAGILGADAFRSGIAGILATDALRSGIGGPGSRVPNAFLFCAAIAGAACGSLTTWIGGACG